MNFSLNVDDIELLRKFKGALKHFAEKTEGNIESINLELQRISEWIEERVQYWRLEVERAAERVNQATEDLSRYESENDSDDNYRDCSYEEEDLREANWELEEYRENLETAERWRFTLENAIDEYYKSMSCFHDLAAVHSCSAQTFLAEKIEKYFLVHSGNTNISLSDYSEISQRNWHEKLLTEDDKSRVVSSVFGLSYIDIKDKADEIRKRVGYVNNTLTDVELVAINRYTSPLGSQDINKSLLIENSDEELNKLNTKYKLLAEIISSGLKKISDYHGVCTRKVDYNEEVLSEHKVGSIVTYKPFTSCTYSKEDVFKEKPIRLIIFSKHGKIIDFMSVFPEEKEVILDKETKFSVDDVNFTGNQVEITLTEI